MGAARTSIDRSLDTLNRTKSSVGKLAERLIKAREHIDWCHRVIADYFTPIWSKDFPGMKGNCRFMGLHGWTGRPHCNHRPSKKRDGVCGVHWNVMFGHEWDFMGMSKYNKEVGFPAVCALCGVRRSKATIGQKCSLKGEKQWLEKELSRLRSLL